MIGPTTYGGKREILAKGLFWSGATFLLNYFPARDSLLVLNYHRLGNAKDDLFDSDIFSATADQLYEQVTYLKRHVSLVTLEEALAFVYGTHNSSSRRCRALLTFDDGYLDNYQLAFPVLRALGVQGVFFLATNIVGSCHIPWWDQIAYMVKTARKRRFTLSYPAELIIDLDQNGLARSLTEVADLYKRPLNTDGERFIRELAEGAKPNELPRTVRRFIDWAEAAEMIRGGMAIGSHTHSHRILSQLGENEQRQELVHSRLLLKQNLGIEAQALAYPVGLKTSFSEQTQLLARESGYRGAFSYYDGTNTPGETSPYDIKRVCVGTQSWPRFQTQAAICRSTGKHWP